MFNTCKECGMFSEVKEKTGTNRSIESCQWMIDHQYEFGISIKFINNSNESPRESAKRLLRWIDDIWKK